MRKISLILSLFLCGSLVAQDHLYEKFRESDKSKHAYGYLDGTRPSNSAFTFNGFEPDNTHHEWVKEEEHPTMSNKKEAFITISKEHIARLVMYATILNDKERETPGSIKIKVFRKGKLQHAYTYEQNFTSNVFEDIYLNFDKAGLDSIHIAFSEKGFVIGKLKVIPLNEEGIKYFQAREGRERQIQDLSFSLDTAIHQVGATYIEELSNIRFRYSQLTKIIHGVQTGTLATDKANSTNPLENEKFMAEYETFLEKHAASPKVQEQFNTIKSKLKQMPLQAILGTADQLLTGGRFANIINLMDNAFAEGIKLEPNSPSVMMINAAYYYKKELSNASLRLTPIGGQDLIRVQQLVNKNDSFVIIMNQMVEYYYKDIADRNDLNDYITKATRLKTQYEQLTKTMFSEYMNGDTVLFDRGDMKALKINNAFRDKFDPITMSDIDKLELRRESDRIIDDLSDLHEEYTILMSKIKSQYDKIYEDVPKAREEGLAQFSSEGSAYFKYYDKFKKSQIKLRQDYQNNGVKDALHQAAGS